MKFACVFCPCVLKPICSSGLHDLFAVVFLFILKSHVYAVPSLLFLHVIVLLSKFMPVAFISLFMLSVCFQMSSLIFMPLFYM